MSSDDYAVCKQEGPVNRIDRDNPTVSENIDRKIRNLRLEIARLEAAKVQMTPLLSMKIGDLREVMSY